MTDLDPLAADAPGLERPSAAPGADDDPTDRFMGDESGLNDGEASVDDGEASVDDGEASVDDGEASPSAGRRRRLPRPGRRAGFVAVALAGAVLGGLVVGVAGGSPGTPRVSAVPSGSPSASSPPGVGEAGVVVAGPSLGDPAALETIEIWADYQCPYCRLEDSAFGGTLERELALQGKVRLEYHDFAFLGQESIDAAVAARCAGQQMAPAYWRYHDLLFVQQQGENQGAFSRSNLIALAEAASLDRTAFSACLDDPSVAQAVKAETSRGRAMGVESTPTLRIVGPGGTKLLKGFSSTWAALTQAIDAVASAAPPGSSPSPSAGGSPGSASPAPSSSPSRSGPSPSAP